MKTKLSTIGLACAIAITALGEEPTPSDVIGIDIATIEYERARADQAAQQRELELQQAMARAAAHTKMPSTMYASTPSDPNDAPHSTPGDSSQSESIVELLMPRYLESVEQAASIPFSDRLKSVLRTALTVEQSRGRRDSSRERLRSQHTITVPLHVNVGGRSGYDDHLVIPYFPAASAPSDRQGLLRLVNLAPSEGEVTIEAIDDNGVFAAPITISIDAKSAVNLNSVDLEQGNPAKGLSTGTGPGFGAWVLVLSSSVEIEAHAHVQTADGYLTSLIDTAPKVENDLQVTYLTEGNDANAQDFLRLVNLTAVPAEVVISRFDESMPLNRTLTIELPPHHARTYDADEIATGAAPGLSGFLGEAKGLSRLTIETVPGVVTMSFALNSDGHLTNLSSLPESSGTRSVPLFMSASDPYSRQGSIQVINREGRPGMVSIRAVDDSGRTYETLSLTVDSNSSVEIDSNDLELGSPSKGLPRGTGSGEGNWRLDLSSELAIEILSFVKTRDGLLTPMHGTVSRIDNRHFVSMFKAVNESRRVGLLRLINVGSEPAHVTIEGTDDLGVRHGTVGFTLRSNASRTLSATELESGGQDLHGMLGNGFGEWRLTITSDPPIEVMNLLATPTGHLTNLSTAMSIAVAEEETAESVFESTISPIIQGDCITCHVVGGFAQNSRLIFVTVGDPAHLTKNLNAFKTFIDTVDEGADLILDRIQGVGHPPGVRIAAGTDEFASMQRFLELLGGEVTVGPSVTAETLFDGVTFESHRQTLRRAAVVFAGRVPTDDEYASLAEGDEVSLRTAIRELMQGSGFHEFLIRASNDRLFTDRDFRILDDDGDGFVEFPKRLYNERQRGEDAYRKYLREAQHGFRRAPLELIAHVVENELPYTEILTADYIMANPMSANAYGALTEFTNEDDPHEFEPSEIVNYYRPCEGYEIERDDVGYVVISNGPCVTDYPHAGLLNTKVFMQRYPTTATNRNRARSRWTYYHFLGVDVEKSASRTTDPVALADTNNPTLGNPACTVCHAVLDPVAGVFQNYGDDGLYRDQWGGLDALDRFYKYNPAGRKDITIQQRSEERSIVSLGTTQLFADRDNELGLKNLRTFEGDTKLHLGLGEVSVVDMNGNVVHRFEVRDVAKDEDCGDIVSEGYILWDCSELLALPLAVSVNGEYELRVETWVFEEGEVAATLQAWMPGPFYRKGDTWYRDMRQPGIGDEHPSDASNSTQWLAEQIVSDDRFAEAAVKFWWPAIMGTEIIEPPEDTDDADFEAELLAANAQAQIVQRLAGAFRLGFEEGDPFNLKDLLVEITLSPWFRAESTEADDALRRTLQIAGVRRLATPAELANKTLHLTGFQWGRNRDRSWIQPHEEKLSSLTDPERGYGLLYGGIDSDGVIERARDLTSMMAGVAQSHAAESSCPIVMRELFLLPDEDRLLFSGFDRKYTPNWEFGETFTIEAAAFVDRETLVQTGHLSIGIHEVSMSFINDYSDDDGDRNVRLYELRVLNEDDEVVHESSLKDLTSPVTQRGSCGSANAWNEETEERDHFNLYSTCSPVLAQFDIETEGSYAVEVVAWADQYGEELAELEIVIQSNTESSAGALSIRRQLVQLYDRLHGIAVDTDSPEIHAAFELFVNLWEANLDSERASSNFLHWQNIECDWAADKYFFEGILEDAWVYRDDWGDVWGARHDWDREHIGKFLDTVDFSDRQAVARTWVSVMAYLLMDYRYLYL